MLQAGVLRHLVGALVDGERRRLGDVEDLDAAVLQLDAAGGEPGVDILGGASGNHARHQHHVLRTYVDGIVDDGLGDTGVVTDVEESKLLAVLAAGGNPAGEGDVLPDVFGAQLAALMGTHGRGAHERAFWR